MVNNSVLSYPEKAILEAVCWFCGRVGASPTRRVLQNSTWDGSHASDEGLLGRPKTERFLRQASDCGNVYKYGVCRSFYESMEVRVLWVL